jgi:hypothetical protein
LDNTIIIPIISLIVTLTSVITSFILQVDKNAKNKLEQRNVKLGAKIQKLTEVITAYMEIEEKMASEKKLDVAVYRKNLRSSCEISGDKFMSPSEVKDIQKYIEYINS